MGILDMIKISLGATYNKHKHSYHTDRLKEGEMMRISDKEYIKNEKNRILYCKMNKRGKFNCKKTPIKSG